jgi:dienelactone hydrolase
MSRFALPVALLLLLSVAAPTSHSADSSLRDNPQLAEFFNAEVERIEKQSSLSKYATLEEWEADKPKLRTQLFDMLGLNPLPERTPLQPQITRTSQEGDVRVENIHFQSLPGLYVTGNLYLPANVEGPLPTVLYVCGHGGVKKDGVSYGNKTHYTHHGSWFARNGYACLTIDTLQLGEIEGIHHGTYRYDRWWWNARGYSPAGIEAWNCIRALDYLETRPEVDASRFGVTGRSGGGAYSWWIAALDERIQCAIPVAGITNLRNHVVDGCVEGHCDCMYMVNTYGWDYATVAALVAPRPLLISNSDKDGIFPLDGVVAIHRQVRHIYDLYEKPNHLGLQITEGPHKDTQELRVHAFRWLNRWLKNDESLIETTATKMFVPEQLRVFTDLPGNERNTTIDQDFVPAVSNLTQDDAAAILNDSDAWSDSMLAMLRRYSFAAWPDASANWTAQTETKTEPVTTTSGDKQLKIQRLHFESQKHVPMHMDIVSTGTSTDLSQLGKVRFIVASDQQWQAYSDEIITGKTAAADRSEFVSQITDFAGKPDQAVVVFSPRGQGPVAWAGDNRKQIQIRRRFQLIGTTIDAARVWDIRRALQTLRSKLSGATTLTLTADGSQSPLVLMASLFEPAVSDLTLTTSPELTDQGPIFLNSQRFLDTERLLLLGLHHNRLQIASPMPSPTINSITKDARWQGHHLE